MLICVGCFGLVVSTCQVIGWKDPSERGEEITSKKPRWKRVFVCIFLLFGLFMLLCIAHGPTQYIFHMPMTRYSIFLLKVSLNTGKTNVLVGRQEGHPACKKVGCWFVGCVTI